MQRPALGPLGYHEMDAFSGPPDELDKLIEWKAGSPAVLKHYRMDTITRGAHMQRQFTIELRVDFADQDKLEPLKQTLRQAARHCYAAAMLISDNPKATQIVIYSEDFFSAHEEIKLLDDIIQEGLDTVGADSGGTDGVSSELAAAASDGV